MKQKAWSTFEIKSVDEDQRIIRGIASTPSTDRDNDIVNPLGANFSLPLPFLWMHDSSLPVGQVIAATPTDKGIPVTIQLAKVTETGTLKDRLDEAWQSIKAGLVRGLSIGFRPTESERLADGGRHFKAWDWYELSAVTIAANAEASITSIKRADRREIVQVKFAEPRVDPEDDGDWDEDAAVIAKVSKRFLKLLNPMADEIVALKRRVKSLEGKS